MNILYKNFFLTFKIVNLFLLIVLFSSCANKQQYFFPQKKSTQYTHLELNSNNNFTAPPRSALIIKNNIFVGFDNGEIVKWSLEDGNLLNVFFTHDTYPKRFLIESDSKILSGSSSMKLEEWTIDGKFIREKNYENGSVFQGLKIGKYVYLGFGNASLGVVDYKTLDMLSSYREHDYLIYSLYYDKEKSLIFTGSDDNSIIVWKLLDNGLLTVVKRINDISNAANKIIKYNNNYIVLTGDGKIVLYNESIDKIKEYKEHNSSIISTNIYHSILLTGDIKGNVNINKIQDNELTFLKSYKLNSSIRIIIVFKNYAVIFCKNGYIKKILLNKVI